MRKILFLWLRPFEFGVIVIFFRVAQDLRSASFVVFVPFVVNPFWHIKANSSH